MNAAPLAAHAGLLYRVALGLLGAVLAISVLTDLRSRLIYNWVTGPAFLLELSLIWLALGVEGLETAALGLLVCAGPLALGCAYGEWRGKTVFGAGDVKLISIVGLLAGAAHGWYFALIVLVDVSIAGGLLAGLPWIAAAVLRRERPEYVPYGVAIAAGALVAWIF